MKKYRVIGLSVLLAVFIASNFIVSYSTTNGMNSNISVLINQAGADPEGSYGNDRDGTCDMCVMDIPGGNPVYGVYIHCWSQVSSCCIVTNCSYGFC